MQQLPTQYDHHGAQQRWFAFWEAQHYFDAVANRTGKPFSIVIPPPNVTGALHLGHALNNTLQDIVVRMRRMQGYDVLWMPGTDHAGIATQAVVERRIREQENLSRHDLGRDKLVERIWEWKDEYEARILGQLKQLGSSCDWRRTRFTLDPVCAKAVRRTFFGLFNEGLIYRGKKLVNWDTFLQTAVSDDEVFKTPVKGSFWHFRYPLIDAGPGEPEHVEIATTRPETMLGDTAVAVHPDPDAAFDRAEAELRQRLADASAREQEDVQQQLDHLAKRREALLPRLRQLRDLALAGRCVLLPLLRREIPLVCDEWAKPELGTGCVKITPAHDPNDYEVGLRRGLPMINILRTDGTLNSNAGPYEGLTIKQARNRVVDDLEQAGLLGDVEDREIELPHSDRSKTPIEPFLANQWFVKMDHLAQTAMDAVTSGDVRIVPDRYAKGYLDWLGEKRDWPIGRQLWWGHRIPIWSRGVASEEELARLQSEIQADPAVQSGAVVWQIEEVEVDDESEDAEPIHAYLHLCPRDEDEQIEARLEQAGFNQVEDVLDTWFSSALWPTPRLAGRIATRTWITSIPRPL